MVPYIGLRLRGNIHVYEVRIRAPSLPCINGYIATPFVAMTSLMYDHNASWQCCTLYLRFCHGSHQYIVAMH